MGTPFSFEVFKFKSLLRNRSAGDPIARITCRIGLHIVGFGMDDQGRPAVAEHRMIVAAEIYILVRDGHLGRAIRPNHKIRHVAGVEAHAGECIDRGYSVLVFPEGHHTTDGRLRPFRGGVGLLAKRLGVPVVPMRIDGLFEVKHAGKRFAPPGKIRIRIGQAVSFEAIAEPLEIARELQKRVAEL